MACRTKERRSSPTATGTAATTTAARTGRPRRQGQEQEQRLARGRRQQLLHLHLKHGKVHHNEAGQRGGGVLNTSGTVVLRRTHVDRNRAIGSSSQGGGIYYNNLNSRVVKVVASVSVATVTSCVSSRSIKAAALVASYLATTARRASGPGRASGDRLAGRRVPAGLLPRPGRPTRNPRSRATHRT